MTPGVRTRSDSRAARARRAALAALVAYAVGLLAPLLHLASVPHELCSQDGELRHGVCRHEGGPASAPPVASDPGDSGEPGNHERCPLVAQATPKKGPVPVRVVGHGTDATPRRVAPVPRARSACSDVPLFLLAPKNSPPRAV